MGDCTPPSLGRIKRKNTNRLRIYPKAAAKAAAIKGVQKSLVINVAKKGKHMTLYTFLNYLKDYIPIEIIYKKEDQYYLWKKGKAETIKDNCRREELEQWEMMKTKSRTINKINTMQILVRKVTREYGDPRFS